MIDIDSGNNNPNEQVKMENKSFTSHVYKTLRSPLLLIAIILLLIFLLTSIFPTFLETRDPHEQSLTERLVHPGYVSETGHVYWLGSDYLGRDVLSRLIHGSRVTLFIGLISAVISAIIGTLIGLISGYKGRWISEVSMRIADIQLAFPFFLIAVTISAILGGNSITIVIVLLALANWVPYARVVRSEVLTLREQQFVSSARAIGLPTYKILFRHILPNCRNSILVLFIFNIALAIVFEAGLSFLGLGVPAHYSSWGEMLGSGRQYVDSAWWIATFPGACIFLVTLSINIVGDYIGDTFDPYMKRRI